MLKNDCKSVDIETNPLKKMYILQIYVSRPHH